MGYNSAMNNISLSFIYSFVLSIILFCPIAMFGQEQEEIVQIKQADSLTFQGNELLLEGNVVILAKNISNFDGDILLYTDKLILNENEDEYPSIIKTFGHSSLVSKQFKLTANKLILKSSAGSNQLDYLEAIDNVKINTENNQQVLTTPYATIDLNKNILKAHRQVATTVKMKSNKTATVTSAEQEIFFKEKYLIATGKVKSKFESSVIQSERQVIHFDEAPTTQEYTSQLKATDNAQAFVEGATLKGNSIELFKDSKGKVSKSLVKGNALLVKDEYTVKSDEIELKEKTTHNVLITHNKNNAKLSTLTSDKYFATAEHIIFIQNKQSNAPEAEKEKLYLQGKAKVKDLINKRELDSDFIVINTKEQSFNSGGSRAKGNLILNKASS